jgi:hypothetical protein
MRPTISEFSYGFAVTSELLRAPGMVITAAPVFPSLSQEGQAGGGWDVQINRPGIPLFLQFKLCDCMTRRTCKEARDGGFDIPCYRMHLRSARISRQHEMLLDLEAKGQEVYYVGPKFHRPEELNAAFLAFEVRARSFWVRPSDIGPLPDDGEHHVSFDPNGQGAFFSKPTPLKAKREFRDVLSHFQHQLTARGKVELQPETLEYLAESIGEIAQKRADIAPEETLITRQTLQGVAPLQRVAYYASVFLESQLFVIQERE